MDWMRLGLPLLAGGINSLFGQEPEGMTDQQRRMWKEMKKLLKFWRQYSDSAPGSQPLERAALDQSMGLLGQQGAQAQQSLLAAMGPPGGPGASNAAAAMSNLQSNLGAQRAGLQGEMMRGFLQDRFNAKGQMGNLIGMGAGMAERPQPGRSGDMSDMLMRLGYEFGGRQGSGDAGNMTAPPRTPAQPGQESTLPGVPKTPAGTGVPYTDAQNTAAGAGSTPQDEWMRLLARSFKF